MKLENDAYTIMIFRGVMANPLKIHIRKVFLKGALCVVAALCLVQAGVVVHYVMQTGQIAELQVLKKEMVRTDGRVSVFSESIADMKRRMLSMQELNKKLQTMFGLDPEPVEDAGSHGRGGEDFPYDVGMYGEQGLRPDASASRTDGADAMTGAPPNPRDALLVNMGRNLVWLDRHAIRQQHILDRLEKTAGARVDRWAATPSIWPVKGHLTSKFGKRISPFTGKKVTHAGIDIGGPTGRKIRAPASGKVVAAARGWKMGNFIRIAHGYGIETTYGHLSKMLVKYGQKVRRGDVIGLLGNTGKYSTGPHLHYQVAVDDHVVDPFRYILD